MKVLVLFLCSACFGSIESFTTGQTTPLMEARTDFKKYPSASRTMENVFVYPQGPATRRPGTEYIADVNDLCVSEYPTLRTTAEQDTLVLTKTTAVANLTDLENMANDLAGNYYLTGDIDASATSGGGYNSGKGWAPIGEMYTAGFTGTFDGCGYTITGLYINRSSVSSYFGLFGLVKSPAQIANVTLADCDITARGYTGSLVGSINVQNTADVIVQNCHSSGSINVYAGYGGSYVGGLIGYTVAAAGAYKSYIYDCSSSCTVTASSVGVNLNHSGFIGAAVDCIIQNCYATGAVDGNTLAQRCGGFIGSIHEYSTISFCYSTGNVTDGADNTGGFAGRIAGTQSGITVSKCYSTSDIVTDADYVGGFIGYLYYPAEFDNCYAWGDVTGGTYVGGFAGIAGGAITNCYSIGSATGTASVGGLVGYGGGTGTSLYWDTEASGNATSDGDYDEEGKTTNEMKTESTYVDWDFDTIWYMPACSGGTSTRLIPFEYSTDDAYVLALGDGIMGFFRTTE
jgi:hypothetical protein